jgi:hypothetical protein
MDMTLEQQLREALRARDPGEDFTRRVLARVQPGRQLVTTNAPQSRRRWQVPVALAATLLAALIGLQQLQQYRERERAAQAGAQLLLALQITSHELNEVQRRLSRPLEEKGT